MSLYLVAQLTVRDRAALVEYARRVRPLMREHGGEIVALSWPDGEVLEGEAGPDVIVVVHRWCDRAGFDAFWNAPAYEPLRRLRHAACDSLIQVMPST